MSNSFRIFQIVLAVLLSIATGVVWITAYNDTRSVKEIEQKEQQEEQLANSFNLTFDNKSYSFDEEGMAEVDIWTIETSSLVEGVRMVLKYDKSQLEIVDIKKGNAFDIYVDEGIDTDEATAMLSGAYEDKFTGYSKQLFAQVIVKKIGENPNDEYNLEISDESLVTLSNQPLRSIQGDKLKIK
ncbi:hypothetical protein KC678_05360 [Candidatus Dojkabacteria bacterium]|uniref:Uncharacterized protein n=1 Tax=Candidatus Dojkabacteria bacterium TaxID=2099670 RepID=A0A955L2F8_9BACT|nr:hypothetical protein [Candidatus Dojkabacteria bacterium]